LTDTSLYIYIRVKHFGMANIKLHTLVQMWLQQTLFTTSPCCLWLGFSTLKPH